MTIFEDFILGITAATAVEDWSILIPEQSKERRPADRILKISKKKLETHRTDNNCYVNTICIDYFSSLYTSHLTAQNQSRQCGKSVERKKRKRAGLVLNLKFVFRQTY